MSSLLSRHLLCFSGCWSLGGMWIWAEYWTSSSRQEDLPALLLSARWNALLWVHMSPAHLPCPLLIKYLVKYFDSHLRTLKAIFYSFNCLNLVLFFFVSLFNISLFFCLSACFRASGHCGQESDVAALWSGSRALVLCFWSFLLTLMPSDSETEFPEVPVGKQHMIRWRTYT